MDKWTLLFISILTTGATIISYLWWRGAAAKPDQDIEDLVGYDGSKLPPDKRRRVGRTMRAGAGAGLDVIVLFFACGMVVCITATIKAFLS
jgi:hypothetical protein